MGPEFKVPMSILKKRPLNTVKDGFYSKKVKTEAELKMEVFIERIKTTGLESTYLSEIHRISESDPPTQTEWLQKVCSAVACLDKRAENFVRKALQISWHFEESAVRGAYQQFLMCLAVAPTVYCAIVIEELFEFLAPDVCATEDAILRVNPHLCNSSKQSLCGMAVETINFILEKVPLSSKLILEEANSRTPYYKSHPYKLVVYLKSLLILADNIASLRSKFLELAIHVILKVDSNCPRSDLCEDEKAVEDEDQVFNMEVEDTACQQQASALKRIDWIEEHPVAHNLDVLMDVFFIYIHCVCHGVSISYDYNADLQKLRQIGCEPRLWSNVDRSEGGCECGGVAQNVDAVKKLYVQIRDIFSQHILPTHSCGHVQFIIFYIISLRVGLRNVFLEHLRINYVEKTTVREKDVRKNALYYIGGLLVRGKFVPFSLVHSSLQLISNWCQNYIQEQERSGYNYLSLPRHEVFYAACQTIFYVFSFRYLEYTKDDQAIKLAKNLNLSDLVTSKMNPLAVCQESLVGTFASITRHFQILYCYTIIENNSRCNLTFSHQFGDGRALVGGASTTLDSFFPFDPYLLPESSLHVLPHYVEFRGLPDTITTEGEGPNPTSPNDAAETNDEDDFLDMSCPSARSFTDVPLSPK